MTNFEDVHVVVLSHICVLNRQEKANAGNVTQKYTHLSSKAHKFSCISISNRSGGICWSFSGELITKCATN